MTTTRHIGLMGTHGTGKSTFARALWAMAQEANHGISVAMIKEIARKCPLPVNRKTSELAQLWIFHRQMWEELAALGRGANWVICDRTALDSLAYAEAAGLDEVVDACLPEALEWMDRYTDIYWFRPVPGRLVEDGFRDTDPAFQAEIDNILEGWVQAYGIQAQEAPPCSIAHLRNTA